MANGEVHHEKAGNSFITKERIPALMMIFTVSILILALTAGISPLMAQGKSSFSAQTPDAIKFTPPPPPNIPDPCKAAWKKIKGKIGSKSIGNDSVSISPKQLFKNRCNKYKDDLTAWARKPFDDAKSKFEEARDKVLNAPQKALDKAEKDLKDGFYAWAAEEMRKRLPPEERSKYSDLNNPATRAKFQEWANDPKTEFGEYVGAYMNANHPTLASAYDKYVDLTAGQSKEIIDGLNGILSDAKAKLSRFTSAKQEIQADPKAKYKEKLAKAGFSGKWLNKFGKYEGKLRALDRDYDIKGASNIMIEAFQSDVPRDKIKGLFKLMDNLASTAEDSGIPIASLMGTIVKQYAAVANEMLAQIEGLEEALKSRAGYCVGTGSPGLEDPAAKALDRRGILACPLALKRDPWQYIYEQKEGPSPGQIHFWTGKKFIDGQSGGGGRQAVQEAVKLAAKAREIGYKVPKNMKGYAGIYNVPGGIIPLMNKSQKVISGIENTLKSLTQATFKGGKCSRDKVLSHLEKMTGLNIKSFSKELEDKGTHRLITTYAASFVAEKKGFGKSGSARSGAYKTYDDIWAKLQNMQFRFVSGEVRDINKPTAPCPECAGAILDVRVNAGEEVHSCETWQADNKANFSLYVLSQGASSLTVSAEVKGAKSDPYPSQSNFVRVLVRAKKEDEQTAECETAKAKLANARSNAARGNILAAESYLQYAREHNCPSLEEGIAQVQNEIDSRNAANDTLARTAAGSCQYDQIQAAINTLSKSPNKKSRALIAKLEKVREVINTGSADLDRSRDALKAGYISQAEVALDELDRKLKSISDFSACTNMSNALTSARNALSRLQEVLADADRALQQCSTDGIARMTGRLEKMDTNNPAINQKLAALKRTGSAMDKSRQAYLAAKAAYEAGDSRTALSKLNEANSALDAIGTKNACQNARDRYARARDKARDLADLEHKAQNATASCSISDLTRLIDRTTQRNLPIAEKLKVRRATLKSAQNYFQQADAYYRKGDLSSASLNLGKSAEVLAHLEGSACPSINNRINSAISGIATLENNIAGAEQAMTQCQISELATWEEKLARRRNNPRVRSTLARLSKTKARCEKEERERQRAAANADCKRKFGNGFYASPRTSDGRYGCMPTQATANAWCNANNQGSGWVAINIEHNGRHGCRLSRRAMQRNAVNYCKKRFGRAFVRVVWKRNGQYDCQYRTAQPRRNICPQGYYYNANTRRCHNPAADLGRIIQGIQGLSGNRGGGTRAGCPPGTHYNPSLRRCHRDAAPQRRTPSATRSRSCPSNYYFNTDVKRCLPLRRDKWKCPKAQLTKDGRCRIILRR